MAIQKINYEDKANLQIISDIPDRNKASADDINEIKQVVNNNADELQNTKGDISSLDNEISKIIDILPTEQAEGEYISMQDSSDFKFKKFGVEGNSVQDETIAPTTPSTIKNVTGDINITVTDKNMANADDIYARMKAHNAGGCAEKTVDEKECIRINNTLYRPDVDPAFDLLGIRYKENTAYTIRGMVKKDSTTEGQMLIIKAVYTDGSSNQVMTTTIDWQELRLVTNASKTVKYIGFSYGSSAWWLLDKSSIFIAEGDTTDYIANEQQEVTFPLLENQRLMLNDYLADDGVHHVRKQMELDGTETWSSTVITDKLRYAMYLVLQDLEVKNTELEKDLLSNWFVANNSSESTEAQKDNFTFRRAQGGKYLWFFFPKSYFTATTSAEILAEWKAKLAEAKQAGTPMTLEYKTAQETTEAYTEEQQEAYNQFKNLKTYKNGSNVYSTNEVSPIFKVEYVKDLNAVLTQVNQLILEGGI